MTTLAHPVELPARLPFQFTGDGWEYFKIWIANLCLSILTLGIYSPWAKVRRLRYFWGNTRLGDASFDYVANPIAILKGRLLVLGFFAISTAISTVWPATKLVLGLLLLLVVPWAVVRSLVFRARNTVYRNIRFDFRGRYWYALWVYALMPILIGFTLGLIYPALVHQRKRLLVNHSAYGASRFWLSVGAGDFYRFFAKVLLLVIGSAVASALLYMIALPLALLAGPLLLLFLFAYVSAEVSNLAYNGTSLERHAFLSELRPGDLLALYVTNALGILLTAGLLIPWARVRMARYRLEHLALLPHGDLDSFVAVQLEEVGSAGDEAGGLLDIDLGL